MVLAIRDVRGMKALGLEVVCQDKKEKKEKKDKKVRMCGYGDAEKQFFGSCVP